MRAAALKGLLAGVSGDRIVHLECPGCGRRLPVCWLYVVRGTVLLEASHRCQPHPEQS
jgi:hypothetical protein